MARSPKITSDPRQSIGDEIALAYRSADASHDPAPTWGDEVERQRDATTPSHRWLAIALAILVGGPFAIIGALWSGSSTGGITVGFIFLAVVIGPAVEEVMKAAGALYLVERRPWLVPTAKALPWIAVAAGLGFAVIENWVYLNIYIDDPSEQIRQFRYIAGPLLHGSASLLAGIGVMKQFERQEANLANREQLAVGALDDARWPWFLAAWILHGGYNLTVTILSIGGWGVPNG